MEAINQSYGYSNSELFHYIYPQIRELSIPSKEEEEKKKPYVAWLHRRGEKISLNWTTYLNPVF